MMCCDCGLVHRMNFRIVKVPNRQRVTQKVQFQAFRDGRSTAAGRRRLTAGGGAGRLAPR